MRPRSVAHLYHAATKYTPEGLAATSFAPDPGRQPAPFKDYPAAHRVPLGDALPRDEASGWEAPWGSLEALARLLYIANGVTAVVPYPERPLLMRAAPSAGGLYPTELYVATRGVPGVPDGLANYQVRDAALVAFWEDPGAVDRVAEACWGHPAVVPHGSGPQVLVVATAVFDRSAWRYRDRAYRRICLDTGHVLGNLVLAAPLFGCQAVPVGGFRDQALEEVLFLDPEAEGVLAVVGFREPWARVPATARPSSKRAARAVAEGERLHALHAAGRIEDAPAEAPALSAPKTTAFRIAAGEPLGGDRPLPWTDPEGRSALVPTVLRRRSTRAYAPTPIPRAELGAILDFTYRTDPAVPLFTGPLIRTFLAVHRVEGLAPGCYAYEPATGRVRQIRFDAFAEEVKEVCLGQKLGSDAAAVVFHTADLGAAVEALGDRAYRYLHLDAGHLGQRLNLAAVRLGLGASGIGGFFDDQVNDLLGLPEDEAILYITTLGVPKSEE